MAESPFIHVGGEISLKNLAQRDLLMSVIARGVPFRFRAMGTSMWPFIHGGDTLTVSPLADVPIRMGDVVAIMHPESDRLAIHRVIEHVSDGWVVRGDNNPEPDGVVTHERIIGRVIRVERDGRQIRFSLGTEAAVIAWLVRHNVMLRAKVLYLFPRRMAGAILRRAQNRALYRTLARRFSLHLSMIEASEEDEEKVHAHFNPGMEIRRRNPGTNVTNYVVKRGKKIVGFVQLVRHPEAHFPWVGHWLFSLEVWFRYRGFGIGEMLTRRVIEQTEAESASELLLVVFEDNHPAINLYDKLGFEHFVLEGLEQKLEEEARQSGRRRIAMRKKFVGRR